MKDEQKLQLMLEKPDFLCESGSHLYGTKTPTSDYDLRGFILPPFSYLIGVNNFKVAEMEGDKKIHNLKSFLELVIKGDPQSSELFFADKCHHLFLSEYGEKVLSLRDDIISNAIFGRIMGYSIGEWRKAMAIQVVPVKWKKEKYEIINDIRNLWHPDKESMDNIISSLEKIDKVETIFSKSGLGVKRKEDVDKYGFCRKSAAHAIRLVNQVAELMETGKMTFPRPEASILLDIRNGKYTKEELEEMHNEAVFKAESARKISVLRDKADVKKVWNTYIELVSHYLVYGK